MITLRVYILFLSTVSSHVAGPAQGRPYQWSVWFVYTLCICSRVQRRDVIDSDLRVCNAGMPMTPSELGQANFGPTIPRASTSPGIATARKRSLSLDMDLVHDSAPSKLGITSATLKPGEERGDACQGVVMVILRVMVICVMLFVCHVIAMHRWANGNSESANARF